MATQQPRGNGVFKPRRDFGNPVSDPKPHQRFIPIPASISKPNDLSYNLHDALSKKEIEHIYSAKRIVFHALGDTGGIHGTETQDAIAYQMEQQIKSAHPADRARFFYHLGDVVYYNGLKKHYEDQFYEPYKFYPSVIFSIPGNHDCDTEVYPGNEQDHETSLAGFAENFCDALRRPVPYSPYRLSMNQPYPYWRLNAPYVTIVGLFSNVDGSLDHWNDASAPQFTWLVKQLKTAPKDKCLVLTVHHPPFSLDTSHGGYPGILDSLDRAANKAQRHPDAVFSGHVHNYQRFTRVVKGKNYPYIVAGAGGYVHEQRSMHRLQKDAQSNLIKVPFKTAQTGLTLDSYNQTDPGFLKITIDHQTISGEYYVNTWDGSKPAANAVDTFIFDWKKNSKV